MKTEKKSGAARSQPAVTDEWWSDERVRSFLDIQPQADIATDYHVLLKAYRGMVPEAFSRFIPFFVEAGRNLNESGPPGKTLLQVIVQHRHASEYVKILKDAGAQ